MPAMVVAEVRVMARSLSQVPLIIESIHGSDLARRSIVVTRMMELFTTIPASPIRAVSESRFMLYPSSKCPKTAPTMPMGIIAMTTTGQV